MLHQSLLKRRNPSILVIVFTLALALVVGCGGRMGQGSLEVVAAGPRAGRLASDFTTAVYTQSENLVASIYLTDIPVESLLAGDVTSGQIINLELLWKPIPGETPLESTATNLSIQHVVIANDQLGMYGGTGFAWPGGTVGETDISLSVSNASLSLLESTQGFVDRLTPALLSGQVTAVHNPQLARRIGLATSQVVTNKLGQPRFVRAD